MTSENHNDRFTDQFRWQSGAVFTKRVLKKHCKSGSDTHGAPTRGPSWRGALRQWHPCTMVNPALLNRCIPGYPAQFNSPDTVDDADRYRNLEYIMERGRRENPTAKRIPSQTYLTRSSQIRYDTTLQIFFSSLLTVTCHCFPLLAAAYSNDINLSKLGNDLKTWVQQVFILSASLHCRDPQLQFPGNPGCLFQFWLMLDEVQLKHYFALSDHGWVIL